MSRPILWSNVQLDCQNPRIVCLFLERSGELDITLYAKSLKRTRMVAKDSSSSISTLLSMHFFRVKAINVSGEPSSLRYLYDLIDKKQHPQLHSCCEDKNSIWNINWHRSATLELNITLLRTSALIKLMRALEGLEGLHHLGIRTSVLESSHPISARPSQDLRERWKGTPLPNLKTVSITGSGETVLCILDLVRTPNVTRSITFHFPHNFKTLLLTRQHYIMEKLLSCEHRHSLTIDEDVQTLVFQPLPAIQPHRCPEITVNNLDFEDPLLPWLFGVLHDLPQITKLHVTGQSVPEGTLALISHTLRTPIGGNGQNLRDEKLGVSWHKHQIGKQTSLKIDFLRQRGIIDFLRGILESM
ncbi:hypothetical protein QCA50_013590 [Cerrena zonata]|uniref:F-box protein n=1 Tax=Cerrena zonata TaxID=2478898 RepID=A0AAW0G095_9APHY